jgi:hypothetical protein
MHDPPEPFASYAASYADADWRERVGPLGILALGELLRSALRVYERQLVIEARREGATWEQIGAALNTQKQNAHRRFRHVEEG